MATGKVPAWILVCVILAYIGLGAAIFATYQGWTFVDGLFFSFAVLGTIGLIDIPRSSPSIGTTSSYTTSTLRYNRDAPEHDQKDGDVANYANSGSKGEYPRKDVNSWIHSDTENHLNNQHQQYHEIDSLFVVLCTCYLLIGLALISMCVQLMEHTCRDILQRLATTRLMGRHGSWMFAVYGDNRRMGKSSTGRYWTTSASESPNNSSSWQGLSRQNSRETSVDNLPRQMDASLSRTSTQGRISMSSGNKLILSVRIRNIMIFRIISN